MNKKFIKAIKSFSVKNRKAIYHFSQGLNNKKVVTIQYPFDYSFDANSYNFHDKRFTEQPTIRPINPNQLQHYSSVLNIFSRFVNQKSFRNSKRNIQKFQQSKFIHPLLLEKLQILSKICDQEKLKLDIQFNKQSINQTSGYLQIHGWDLQNQCQKLRIIEKDCPIEKRFLHQLDFFRNKQILTILPKQNIIQGKESQLQKQLQQDILKKQEKKQERQNLKKFFQQKDKGNFHESFFKLTDYLTGIKKRKQKAQEDYLTVDLLKGRFKYRLSIAGNKVAEQQSVDFYSKWVYHVRGNQPLNIKNDRRRILFDFQFWNRGSFIPVKDFTQDIVKKADL